MKTLKQIEIAKKAGISKGFISRVLNPMDPAKPLWETAKKIGKASKTNPVWWVEKDLSKLRPLFGLPIANNTTRKAG